SLTSKDIKLLQKKKEEKDKVLLSEIHNMRISQALSLMDEMLSETVVSPANEHRLLSRTRSPQEHRRRNRVSTKGEHPNNPVQSERSKSAAKPSLGPKGHHYLPARGLTQPKSKSRTF
ncbi:CPLN1 protein, partial [Tricholaema leucomelas]|nr:CPLN1 protein [Tricholaema leucomelas]